MPTSRSPQTIYEIIKMRAEKYPDKPFLAFPGGKIIRSLDLWRASLAVAEALRAAGLRQADRVALVMSRGLDDVIVNLGASLFATAVPLNPESGAREFEYFFEAFGVKILITDIRDGEAVMVARRRKLPIIIKGDWISEFKPAFAAGSRKTSDIAFVLPTSGTTSRPKLVPLSFGNIYSGAMNIKNALKLKAEDRCLSVMPLFHVHGLMVMISTLVTGGFFIYTPKFERDYFFKWLEDFKPTWYTASAALQQYIAGRADKYEDIIKKQKLRLIRSSSAPLPKETTEKLEKIFKAPVAESYGMTEATLQITSQPLPPAKRKFGSVGKPAGVKMRILNGQGEAVPAGSIGEIIIKGKNVIKAYGENPEADRKSFLRGWLKTGDLGFMDKDGFVFIKGRIKEMINKGGEKISPREIDEAILRYPDIEQAIAFSVPHPELGEDIASAVVMKQGKKFNENKIRQFLTGELAGFKIPARIIDVKELPKTGAGKLKRVGLYEEFKHLPALVGFYSRNDRRLEYKKNTDKTSKKDIEKKLIGIWREIFGIKEINLADNFFELGGDSLKAGEFINKAQDMGLIIRHKDLLNYPTIKDLANL
ncbi:MAG: non-ribosomal peptide synthetase [Candidatus Falkowbacteria bacterium]